MYIQIFIPKKVFFFLHGFDNRINYKYICFRADILS